MWSVKCLGCSVECRECIRVHRAGRVRRARREHKVSGVVVVFMECGASRGQCEERVARMGEGRM